MFIDTAHERYYEHIEKLHTYPDGRFYNGYRWELFSNHRVFHKSKFSRDYAKNTIIEASASSIAKILPMEWENWDNKSECWFPEDIYCFDDTLSWYVVFTHEGWDSYSRPELKEDDYIRICFMMH